MKRFIKEYATYKKDYILKADLMKEEIKKDKLLQIEKALKMIDRGYITIDETMKMLNAI